MRARFGGTCACGCRQTFEAGEELVRAAAGWVRAACAPAAARSGPAAPGSAAEVLEVLAGARRVAARVEAERRARTAPERRVG